MRAPLCWLALSVAAVPAPAQQPQPAPAYCNVQIDSSRHSRYVQVPGGVYQTFAGGGIWAHCSDQPTTMYSDSVAWYPERDLLYLIGRVRFQDTVSILNADRVTYYLRQERLFAEGRVYTKNLRTRSDLHGPNLDYYRAAPSIRDTLEIFATGRPTIHFYSAPKAGVADTSEPFVVVSDRAKMRGNDQMWGGGHVTVDRSDLAARGDSAQLDLGKNRGALIGGPPVVDGTGKDAYHLTGRDIRFALTDSHEIHDVLSSGDAAARGPDWHLDADTLDLALDSGKVQRAQAWGRNRRPSAVSDVHTIVADSLDIHMPAQLVRLVWAYGHARTTAHDSASTDEDSMWGDTLRADFGVHGDSISRRKSELEHLTSYGSARALYHVANDQNPRGPKGVNYSRGKRIDIAMDSSRVRTVDVVGQADGIYLEPVPPRPDSTRRADSLSRAAAADSARRSGLPPPPPLAPDTGRRAPADTTRRPAGPNRPKPAPRPGAEAP
jgi:hypothetical protein